MRRGKCHACDGLLDGYLGRELNIPRTFPVEGRPNIVSVHRQYAIASYCYAHLAGEELRRAEYASGFRTMSMFDLDHPDGGTGDWVPMIPQVYEEEGVVYSSKMDGSFEEAL